MSVDRGVALSAQPEEALSRVRMSWEEFLDLPERPRAEWVDGEVVRLMVPVGFRHGDAVGELFGLLKPRFPDHHVVTEVGLRLPHNRLRAPDLMLVRSAPDGDVVTDAPPLVIEVLSRSTRAEDTIRKSVDYLRGGVGQFWVVDPDLRAIDVWSNVDGEWELLARVDDDAPTTAVEVEGVSVPVDLRQILRA